MKFARYVAWILLCKRAKLAEKIYYNSRYIEFFVRDYVLLARPVYCANFIAREWENAGISASNNRTDPWIQINVWTKSCSESTTEYYHDTIQRIGWPDLCKIYVIYLFILLLHSNINWLFKLLTSAVIIWVRHDPFLGLIILCIVQGYSAKRLCLFRLGQLYFCCHRTQILWIKYSGIMYCQWLISSVKLRKSVFIFRIFFSIIKQSIVIIIYNRVLWKVCLYIWKVYHIVCLWPSKIISANMFLFFCSPLFDLLIVSCTVIAAILTHRCLMRVITLNSKHLVLVFCNHLGDFWFYSLL